MRSISHSALLSRKISSKLGIFEVKGGHKRLHSTTRRGYNIWAFPYWHTSGFEVIDGMMDKYEIIIFWSEEDEAYIAEVPELPGCMSHGDSHEAALANIRSAVELWIETAKEFGDPAPKPKGRRLVFA